MPRSTLKCYKKQSITRLGKLFRSRETGRTWTSSILRRTKRNIDHKHLRQLQPLSLGTNNPVRSAIGYYPMWTVLFIILAAHV